MDVVGYYKKIVALINMFRLGVDIGEATIDRITAELLAADCMCKKCECGGPDDPDGGLSGGHPVAISPIILNLDGDTSNDVIALKDSTAYFDMKDWGVANKTGWVSPTDGLLVHDKNAAMGFTIPCKYGWMAMGMELLRMENFTL